MKKVLSFSGLWYKLGGVEEDDCLLKKKKGNFPACIAYCVSSEEHIDKNVLIFNIESACSKESVIMEHACQVQVNCVFSFVKQCTPLHVVVCRVSKVEKRGRCRPLEMDVLRSAVGRIMSTSIRQRSGSKFRKNRGPLKCVSVSCPLALCCGCFSTVSAVPYECSGC